MFKPVGILIDNIANKEVASSFKRKDKEGFLMQPNCGDKKCVYHYGLYRKIIACIRILRNRGVVTYYKADE